MACSKVFKLPELLEIILNFVIHSSDGDELSGLNVTSSRLVNRDWLISVSNCVRKSRKSLIRFELPENTRSEQERKKSISEFICYATSTFKDSKEVFPPFSVFAGKKFFIPANYPLLLDVLTTCASGLVYLDIQLPEHGGMMPLYFPHWSLGSLQSLRIKVASSGRSCYFYCKILHGHHPVAYFTQSILNACKNLTWVDLEFLSDCVDRGFQYKHLPTTLTEIKLDCKLEQNLVQLLARSKLPQLQSLSLCISQTKWEDDLLFGILDLFKSTLKKFSFLYSYDHRDVIKCAVEFQVPLMEKLESLEFESTSRHCQLEPMAHSLQNNFLKLRKICFYNLKPRQFRKWAENLQYVSVKDLKVSMENEQGQAVNFDLQYMQMLHNAFPNVKDLSLTLTGVKMDGVQYIFGAMKQLTRLNLKLKETEIVAENSDLWDALLTGLPLETVSATRNAGGTWERLKFKDEDISGPSIRNLTNLQELCLRSDENCTTVFSHISDAAFYCAFLKMPQLTTLRLKGAFWTSRKMAQYWEELGRKIKNSSDEDYEDGIAAEDDFDSE